MKLARVAGRDRNGRENLWWCTSCGQPFNLGWGSQCNRCINEDRRNQAVVDAIRELAKGGRDAR